MINDNIGIFTYTAKTRLMDKEIGKKWMIENELSKLQGYWEQLSKEIKRRIYTN